MKDVSGYLKQQQSTSSTPEMAAEWHNMEELYNKRLWHQLTLKLTDFVKDPCFQNGDGLIQLYENFINDFEHRINPLSLMEIILFVARQMTARRTAVLPQTLLRRSVRTQSAMLDGTDKNLIGNVENNNPGVLLSGGGGLNKARLKKGARKPPRPSANSRLHDLNNHRPAVQSGPDPQSLHCLPLRPGTKKELLKSKGGKLERGAAQTGVQLNRNLTRPDPHNHSSARLHKPRPASALSPSTKTSPHKPLHKRPLHLSSQNLLEPPQDDPEKVYAGAKFSEPPSPSVLPKPPSHWVGEDRPLTADRSREDRPLTADRSREDRPLTPDPSREDRPLTADRSREERPLTADRSREQMSVHLKVLLKVPGGC